MKKLIHLGTNHCPDFQEVRRVKVINGLCICTLAIIGFFAVVYAIEGSRIGLLSTGISLSVPLVYLLTIRFSLMWSRGLFIIAANLSILSNFIILHYQVDMTPVFFATASAVFVFFPIKQLPWLVVTLASSLTCGVLGQVLAYKSTPEAALFPESLLILINSAIWVVSFVVLAVPLVILILIEASSREAIQKLQKEEAQASKLRGLGVMAAGVAHEINNPLAVISGWLEHLDEIIKGKTINLNLAQKALEQMKKNTDRIRSIVRGLSVFTHNDQNDPAQPYALEVVIKDAVELLGEKLSSSGIEFVGDVPASIVIDCWPGELMRVFVNFISNAIDAIIDGGNPLGGRVAITTTVTTEYVIVAITDNGPGIPQNALDDILQPFYSTKPVGKGTGLGLSIAKGIIDQHQGKLTVTSEPGKTVFTVYLPLRQGVLAA